MQQKEGGDCLVVSLLYSVALSNCFLRVLFFDFFPWPTRAQKKHHFPGSQKILWRFAPCVNWLNWTFGLFFGTQKSLKNWNWNWKISLPEITVFGNSSGKGFTVSGALRRLIFFWRSYFWGCCFFGWSYFWQGGLIFWGCIILLSHLRHLVHLPHPQHASLPNVS